MRRSRRRNKCTRLNPPSPQNRYDGAMAELERNTSYKIHVAQREHMELASTIRTRLVSTVTKKRDKLLREKEQLDIADSSALFLNPNQFAMNIPGSPGGLLNPRKTRHMRHARVTEHDDTTAAAGATTASLTAPMTAAAAAAAATTTTTMTTTTPTTASATTDRGRKRKPAPDDDGTDSPAPLHSFRPLPHSRSDMMRAANPSPYRDARDKTLYAQYEAPVFSIERLFTDKELAHATTIAQISTHHFFHQQPAPAAVAAAAATNGHAPAAHTSQSAAASLSLHTNGHAPSTTALSLDGATDLFSNQHTGVTDDSAQANGATPPPGSLQAPDMERTVSYHATRNATRANPLAALSEAAALTSTTNFTPHLIPITRTDKGAPTPPGVDLVQADNDISLMFREDDNPSLSAADSADVNMDDRMPDSSLRNLRNRFLDQACATALGNAPFRLPIVENGPAHINFQLGVARLPGYGYADAATLRLHMPNAGAPVTSSASAVGAPALPLINDNLSVAGLGVTGLGGGEAMSRTTSFAGSDVGTASGAAVNGSGASTNGASLSALATNGDSGAGGPAMRRVRSRLI